MLIGYARVSTLAQNEDRQIEALKEAGCEKIFIDKISGATSDRPSMNELKIFARSGDTLIVLSLDRFCRNLLETYNYLNEFMEKGVSVKFIKENIHLGENKGSPMDHLMLTIFGAVAQYERSFILERQREGIELAKARGAFKGSKLKLSEKDREYLYNSIDSGVPKTTVARNLGISPGTVYSYLTLRDKNNESASS